MNYTNFSQILLENSSDNVNELKMGIDVEKEHKDAYDFFKKEFSKINLPMPISEEDFYEMIAKAHLKEISDYYTRLKKMEEEGKG